MRGIRETDHSDVDTELPPKAGKTLCDMSDPEVHVIISLSMSIRDLHKAILCFADLMIERHETILKI